MAVERPTRLTGAGLTDLAIVRRSQVLPGQQIPGEIGLGDLTPPEVGALATAIAKLPSGRKILFDALEGTREPRYSFGPRVLRTLFYDDQGDLRPGMPVQREVAQALDWSPSKVLRILNGDTFPSLTDIKALLSQIPGLTRVEKVEIIQAYQEERRAVREDRRARRRGQ